MSLWTISYNTAQYVTSGLIKVRANCAFHLGNRKTSRYMSIVMGKIDAKAIRTKAVTLSFSVEECLSCLVSVGSRRED